jgi:hypothetical protein
MAVSKEFTNEIVSTLYRLLSEPSTAQGLLTWTPRSFAAWYPASGAIKEGLDCPGAGLEFVLVSCSAGLELPENV